VIYVARQLGHDGRLTLSTHGHVIDELDEAPRMAAEDAIRAARGTRCVIGVPSAADQDRGADEAGAIETPRFAGLCGGGRSRTRTWDLFLIREAL
jgi:hypothetical protein